MSVTRKHIPNRALVRVTIDGVHIPTTAGRLREGAISLALLRAWQEFEYENRKSPITGRLAMWRHEGRDICIQIDVTV